MWDTLNDAAEIMQRPDETEAEWTARTGGRAALDQLWTGLVTKIEEVEEWRRNGSPR